MTDELAALRERAAVQADDVMAQLAAAYAHDRAGLEREALRYYEAAFHLGVPDAERRRFLIGYGSTLRNCGRADDAVGVLGQAVAEHPGDAALGAFLALALHSAGHPAAALATLLGVTLETARPDAFGGYERALAAYQRELLERLAP